MAPVRERALSTAATFRRSIKDLLERARRRRAPPAQEPQELPNYNTYGPSSSSSLDAMFLPSQVSGDGRAVLELPSSSSENSIEPTERFYHTTNDQEMTSRRRAFGSSVFRRNRYANMHAVRAPVRPLFGLEEPSNTAGFSNPEARSREADSHTGPTPHEGNGTSAVRNNGQAGATTVNAAPFQCFLAAVTAPESRRAEMRDASTQTIEYEPIPSPRETSRPTAELQPESIDTTGSTSPAAELDAESSEIQETVSVHFSRSSAPTIPRINTRVSTTSSKNDLIIYPPTHQPLPQTPTPTERRMPLQPANLQPLSPSLLQFSQQSGASLGSDPQHSEIPASPASPAKSWTTGRTALDFRAYTRDELSRRRTFDRAKEIFAKHIADNGTVLVQDRDSLTVATPTAAAEPSSATTIVQVQILDSPLGQSGSPSRQRELGDEVASKNHAHNAQRVRPGPGWVRRTNSFPRVSLRRAFN